MLSPECQVCDQFDVSRTTCCLSFVPSTHFSGEITDFVRQHYPGPGTLPGIDNENFRLLNEDIRYELVSLYEDTSTWSAAHAFQASDQEQRLPAGLTRIAQTSAFVHVRVLSAFLLGHVDDANENKPKDFNVKPGLSPDLRLWCPAINSNVLHLNKKRPSPEVVRQKGGKVLHPPAGVQDEVENLTNEVIRLWRIFVQDPQMKPYEKLTDHIDSEAGRKAAQARRRLAQSLGVPESQIPWRPPRK